MNYAQGREKKCHAQSIHIIYNKIIRENSPNLWKKNFIHIHRTQARVAREELSVAYHCHNPEGTEQRKYLKAGREKKQAIRIATNVSTETLKWFRMTEFQTVKYVTAGPA